MTTHRFVTGGFFAECPDCGGHRYVMPNGYVNGRGQLLTAWQCDGCQDDDTRIVCAVDLVLDAGEEADTRTDETGRPALYVITFDEYDDDDDDETPAPTPYPSTDYLTAIGYPHDSRTDDSPRVTWEEAARFLFDDRVTGRPQSDR